MADDEVRLVLFENSGDHDNYIKVKVLIFKLNSRMK